MRAFIAIELPDALCGALAEVPARVGAQGFRLVAPARMHVTLRFFGALDDARVPEVAAALAGVGARHAPLALQLGGAGVFGPVRAPRVLWAGLGAGREALAALVAASDAALAPVVGPRDEPFRAHVTLGRARRGARVDARALRAVGALGDWVAGDVVLFASALGAGGAVHTPVARARLGEVARGA